MSYVITMQSKVSSDMPASSSSIPSSNPPKDGYRKDIDLLGTMTSDPDNEEEQSLMHDFVVLEDVKIPNDCLVFPGSFNPLHEGHVGLVVAALQKMSRESRESGTNRGNNHNKAIPVIFEIAMINADKPPLPKEEIIRRIQQFDPYTNPVLKAAGLTNIAVAITTEPLFLGKTKLFRSSTFLIGSDTLTRLINPKYYGPPLPAMMSPSAMSPRATPVTPGKKRRDFCCGGGGIMDVLDVSYDISIYIRTLHHVYSLIHPLTHILIHSH